MSLRPKASCLDKLKHDNIRIYKVRWSISMRQNSMLDFIVMEQFLPIGSVIQIVFTICTCIGLHRSFYWSQFRKNLITCPVWYVCCLRSIVCRRDLVLTFPILLMVSWHIWSLKYKLWGTELAYLLVVV